MALSSVFFAIVPVNAFQVVIYYNYYTCAYTPPMGVEHSGKGIFGRLSHNAKLFERIEHSGSR